MTDPEALRLLARNIFVFGQCMEGTQFYGLFGMILSLYRQGKLPGIGTMFRYTLRDESNHIELFRRLLLELVAENPGIWTRGVPRGAARADGARRSSSSSASSRDCLPVEGVGLSAEDFSTYIDYVADRRLVSVGLEPLRDVALENPLPWLAELMDVRKEQNFFEGRVTEYQKASSLAARRRRGALGHGHRVRRDPAGPRAQAGGRARRAAGGHAARSWPRRRPCASWARTAARRR